MFFPLYVGSQCRADCSRAGRLIRLQRGGNGWYVGFLDIVPLPHSMDTIISSRQIKRSHGRHRGNLSGSSLVCRPLSSSSVDNPTVFSDTCCHPPPVASSDGCHAAALGP